MNRQDYYKTLERHTKNFIGEDNIVSNPLLDGNKILREKISYDVEVDTSAINEVKGLFALLDKYFK